MPRAVNKRHSIAAFAARVFDPSDKQVTSSGVWPRPPVSQWDAGLGCRARVRHSDFVIHLMAGISRRAMNGKLRLLATDCGSHIKTFTDDAPTKAQFDRVGRRTSRHCFGAGGGALSRIFLSSEISASESPRAPGHCASSRKIDARAFAVSLWSRNRASKSKRLLN